MINLVDTTLRDGGYVIDHKISIGDAVALVNCIHRTSVRTIEVGYFRRQDVHDGLGLAAYCPAHYLQALPKQTGKRHVVMTRPNEALPEDLAELPPLGISGVRIPVTREMIDSGRAIARAARALGLHVCMNIIRCSELTPADVAMIGRELDGEAVDVLYVADSNGAMLPGDVKRMVGALRDVTTKPVGCHTHDNLRMAVANAMAALEAGATWIDSTLTGVGKAAGNAATEIMLLMLERRGGGADFGDIEPLAEAVRASGNALFAHARVDQFDHAVFGHRNLNVEKIKEIRAARAA